MSFAHVRKDQEGEKERSVRGRKREGERTHSGRHDCFHLEQKEGEEKRGETEKQRKRERRILLSTFLNLASRCAAARLTKINLSYLHPAEGTTRRLQMNVSGARVGPTNFKNLRRRPFRLVRISGFVRKRKSSYEEYFTTLKLPGEKWRHCGS